MFELFQKIQEEKTSYSGKTYVFSVETDNLKFFGCPAYVKNRNREKLKFVPKTRKRVIRGYDGNSTANVLQDVETRKFTRARNAVFDGKKVVGFSDESRADENFDLFFDVTFESEIERGNVIKK